MTWLPRVATGTRPLDHVFGLRPDAYARFLELYEGLVSADVDAATLELCRRSVFALLRQEQSGVEALDDAQQAAVVFAEQYVLDPHALTDADFERLHRFYDDAQIATLVLAVAMFDARARFEVALEVS